MNSLLEIKLQQRVDDQRIHRELDRTPPVRVAAEYTRGRFRFKTQDYEAALEPLHDAIRLDPEFSDACYNLAAAYARLGEKENALQHLQRAVRLQPGLAAEARKDYDFERLQADQEFLAVTQP